MYKKPTSWLLWGLIGVGTVAVVYGVYRYFFAKEKKEEKPAETIA
jgi:hypothetical protein